MSDEITYKCPICKGEYPGNKIYKSIRFINVTCDFCKGKKDLNWIEVIFGVDEKWRQRHLDEMFEGIVEKLCVKKRK